MRRRLALRKCNYHNLNISVIESSYGVVYIGDFCIKSITGKWSNIPVSVFYQKNPNTDLGHSHYLGVYRKYTDYRSSACTLVDACSAFSEPIIGIEADNGEIIYSSYRHDFVSSQDGSVFIDGGRDYVKSSVHGKRVYIHMVDGKLEIGEYVGKL